MARRRNLYEGCISVSQPIAFLERLSIQTTSTFQPSLSQSNPIDLTSYNLLPTGKDQTESIVVPGEYSVLNDSQALTYYN